MSLKKYVFGYKGAVNIFLIAFTSVPNRDFSVQSIVDVLPVDNWRKHLSGSNIYSRITGLVTV